LNILNINDILSINGSSASNGTTFQAGFVLQ